MSTQPPTPAAPRLRPLPVSWRLTIVGVALALYVFACCLPAVRMENGSVWYGAEILLLGPFGLLFMQIAWFANLLFIPSLIFIGMGWWRAALFVSLLQVLIALDMLNFPGSEIILDEGGINKTSVLALLPGAWFWLVSLIVPTSGFLVMCNLRANPA